MFLAVLADVGDPGGCVVDGGSHPDGGVRVNGVRPVDQLGGGEHGRRRRPARVPGYG